MCSYPVNPITIYLRIDCFLVSNYIITFDTKNMTC
jgi:hypothetical protein